MSAPAPHVATMSTRLIAPFARVLAGGSGREASSFNFRSWSKRVSHDRAIAMLEDAMRTSGNALLGLHAARAAANRELGWLSYAMQQSETLRESLETVAQYAGLLHDAADLAVEERGTVASWSFRIESGLALPEQAAAYVVSLMARYIERATNGVYRPFELQLRAAAPAHAEAFEQLAGLPVVFGAEENGVLFDAAALDCPMASADPGLRDELCQLGDLLVTRLPERRRFQDQVRTHLREQLTAGRTSAGDTARRFQISERTLRRHLSAEGTSYAELLDQTRRELATVWLSARTRPIAEIAQVLGFSHVSSFYKAFRRWTGQTPVEYRQARKHAAPQQTEPPPRSVVRSDVVLQPDAPSTSAALQRS